MLAHIAFDTLPSCQLTFVDLVDRRSEWVHMLSVSHARGQTGVENATKRLNIHGA